MACMVKDILFLRHNSLQLPWAWIKRLNGGLRHSHIQCILGPQQNEHLSTMKKHIHSINREISGIGLISLYISFTTQIFNLKFSLRFNQHTGCCVLSRKRLTFSFKFLRLDLSVLKGTDLFRPSYLKKNLRSSEGQSETKIC